VNRWLWIRRARGPAFLILVGITALLNQWGVLSFARSWPLYLILAGVLLLAERAAFAGIPPPPIPGQPYAPASGSPPGSGIVPTTTPLPPASSGDAHGEDGRL
jgi:Domain of unknown function (DUF5668)